MQSLNIQELVLNSPDIFGIISKFLTLSDGITFSISNKTIRQKMFYEYHYLVALWILKPMVFSWGNNIDIKCIDRLISVPMLMGDSISDEYINEFKCLNEKGILPDTAYDHVAHFAKKMAQKELLRRHHIHDRELISGFVKNKFTNIIIRFFNGSTPLYTCLGESKQLLHNVYNYSLGMVKEYWNTYSCERRYHIEQLIPPWVCNFLEMYKRKDPRLTKKVVNNFKVIIKHSEPWLAKGIVRNIKENIYATDVKKTGILWEAEKKVLMYMDSINVHPDVENYSLLYDFFAKAYVRYMELYNTMGEEEKHKRGHDVCLFIKPPEKQNKRIRLCSKTFDIPRLVLRFEPELKIVSISLKKGLVARAFIDNEGRIFTSKRFFITSRYIVKSLNDAPYETISKIGLLCNNCPVCGKRVKGKTAKKYGYGYACGLIMGVQVLVCLAFFEFYLVCLQCDFYILGYEFGYETC